MCLLTSNKLTSIKQSITCYKILEEIDSILWSLNGKCTYISNVVYFNELTFKSISSFTDIYTEGFHSYVNYEDAKSRIEHLQIKYKSRKFKLVSCEIPTNSVICKGVESDYLKQCYVSDCIIIKRII